MIYVVFTFLLIYTITDALADAYQFREFRKKADEEYRAYLNSDMKLGAAWFSSGKIEILMFQVLSNNRNWHRAQAVRQGAAIVFAAIAAQDWTVALVGAAGFWLIHDAIVNRIGLDRPLFYVGTTAWIDRLFQRTPNPPLFMGATKVVFLIAATVAYVIL